MAITGLAATAGTDDRDRDRVERCVNGKPEVGDTYYPDLGNTGYDATHYDLDLAYDHSTKVLDGVATIEAAATEDLCQLNLDLRGLTVHSVEWATGAPVAARGPRADHHRAGAAGRRGLRGRGRPLRRAGTGTDRPERLPRRPELHHDGSYTSTPPQGAHLVPEQQHHQTTRRSRSRSPCQGHRSDRQRTLSRTRLTAGRAPRPGGTRPADGHEGGPLSTGQFTVSRTGHRTGCRLVAVQPDQLTDFARSQLGQIEEYSTSSVRASACSRSRPPGRSE